MAKIILGLLAVYLVAVVFLYTSQRRLMYHPTPTKPVISEEAKAYGFAETSLTTSDGLSLNAWYRPPEAGKPVMIHFHGNSFDLSYFLPEMTDYLDEGMGVLLFDYRGFGGNPGDINKPGLLNDARAAIDFVMETENLVPKDIIYFGKSLGTGISTTMAAERSPAALILESPYTTIADVAADKYWFIPFVKYLMRDNFSVIDHIANIDAPLIVLHAVPDVTVPMKFGKRSFDAANHPKEMHEFAEANHGNLHEHGAHPKVIDFLRAHGLLGD